MEVVIVFFSAVVLCVIPSLFSTTVLSFKSTTCKSGTVTAQQRSPENMQYNTGRFLLNTVRTRENTEYLTGNMWYTKYISIQNICKTKGNLSPYWGRLGSLKLTSLQPCCRLSGRPRWEALTQLRLSTCFLDSLLIPWAQNCFCNMTAKGSYCPNFNKVRFGDSSCCEA